MSRAICVPIYGDLYQNLQWSLTFDLKVVTHLKSASEASYDVINMATIMRNCSLIKAMVCRLGPFFWGQIFEFQYFWGFSEK